jgi:hypothetical protein
MYRACKATEKASMQLANLRRLRMQQKKLTATPALEYTAVQNGVIAL